MKIKDYIQWFAMTSELHAEAVLNEYGEVTGVQIHADGVAHDFLPCVAQEHLS